MKQAKAFINIMAECPYCGEGQEVEWVEIMENELTEWSCFNCDKKFTYTHPHNEWGLAK